MDGAGGGTDIWHYYGDSRIERSCNEEIQRRERKNRTEIEKVISRRGLTRLVESLLFRDFYREYYEKIFLIKEDD